MSSLLPLLSFTMSSEKITQIPDGYLDPLAPYRSYPALTTETIRTQRNKYFYEPIKTADDGETAKFPSPIVNHPNKTDSADSGYDTHIYFDAADTRSRIYAEHLHTAIRHQFPTLRVYQILYEPTGPQPTATFEVALFTPAEMAEFVPWLTLWHGPLSALIHTNTFLEGEEPGVRMKRQVDDHTARALWLGKPIPLNLAFFGNQPGGKGQGQKVGDS